MSDIIKKNFAIIINVIILLCALSFGYGLLNKDIENTSITSNKNEERIERMQNEWHRDIKIILEKVNTLEGYIKAKDRIEEKKK